MVEQVFIYGMGSIIHSSTGSPLRGEGERDGGELHYSKASHYVHVSVLYYGSFLDREHEEGGFGQRN